MNIYPKYKDSGIEWLGKIPEHWSDSKIKYNVNKNGYKAGPFGSGLITNDLLETGDYLVYSPEHIINDSVINEFYLPNSRIQEMSQYIVSIGDIIFPIVGTLGRALIITPEHKAGIINQRLAKITPDQSVIVSEYLCQLISDFENVKKYISINSKGAILEHITKEVFMAIPFPKPSIKEQIQIIQFIKCQTKKITSLIEKKQKLIDLLKEYRTAIINQAVTKGLDPNVKLKDSGIEWLGVVPEHWEILQFKHLFKHGKEGIRIGPFGSSLKLEIMKLTGYKVFGQENVIGNDFTLGNRYINSQKFIELQSYEVIPGDIVVTMMGTTGKSKIVPKEIEKGIMDSHLIRIRLNDVSNPQFISLLINDSYYLFTQFKLESKGSIMEGLNSAIIKSTLILKPPIREQNQIVEYLDLKTNLIDNQIEKEQNFIEYLKEYRTALISEVVTGKVDVRNFEIKDLN